MKRILLFLSALFIATTAIAHTINWYVDGNIFHTTTCESGDNVTPPTAPEKYGYTFKGWDVYTPIEYLESTGTQYIDTGYKFSSNNASIHTSFVPTNVDIGRIFGSYNGTRGFSFYIWSKLTIGCGGTDMQTNVDIDTNVLYTVYVTANKGSLSGNVNGINISGTYTGSIVNNSNSYLFRTNERLPYYFHGKLYYFQIYDNNTLVRDFIPVLDKDGVPCMYDKVERKFYYNAGTGDFIAGPIIGE